MVLFHRGHLCKLPLHLGLDGVVYGILLYGMLPQGSVSLGLSYVWYCMARFQGSRIPLRSDSNWDLCVYGMHGTVPTESSMQAAVAV